MKGVKKVTRVQLKDNQDDGFLIFGLVSSEPDYKLSLALNKKFRISFKNISPVRISEAKGSELLFSRFSATGSLSGTVYNLISNRSDRNYLVKKLKNVDYIFQVVNSENENNIDTLRASLKDIECITAVFIIDNSFKDNYLQHLTQ